MITYGKTSIGRIMGIGAITAWYHLPAAAADSAVPAAAAPHAGWGDGLFLVILVAAFYLMLILPQSRRAKAQRQMVEQLAKGDEVVTHAGLVGKITHVGPQYLHMAIHENTVVKIQKQAIAQVLPKGTIDAA